MIPFALLLALIWGCIWAAFLQFVPLGRYLALRRTWITVVVGVGADLLLALLVIPWIYWWPLACIVALSGLPVIARSLINEYRETQEQVDDLKNQAR